MSDATRLGGLAWWSAKVRQFGAHVRAHIPPEERASLAAWAPGWAVGVFDAMHPADRRHGLDVVSSLRTDGSAGGDDEDLLIAGLLHDAGKGQTRVWPRVAYSLGQAYGPTVRRLVRIVPFSAWGAAIDRLEHHVETSARIAAEAGGSARTVELIQHQDAPLDPVAGERLRLADEAN